VLKTLSDSVDSVSRPSARAHTHTGLPKSEGFNVILVVVDRFTKYAHFIPLKHPYTTQGIAKVVFENVVRLHGLLQSIVQIKTKYSQVCSGRSYLG
jgi:hypothetical protein